MIRILDPAACCGCEACAQVCSRRCIEMRRDDKGFLYPEADAGRCIRCGLCEQVCPVLHPYDGQEPLQVLAAKNPDELERKESSSGGVFILLAKQVVQEGGVVFGVSFDGNWLPVHTYAESIEDLKRFQGSKYAQSRLGEAYSLTKGFLATGRKVLFSGTPCQVAGLHHFLRKEYDNLLTVEVLCHGVPSPRVWQDYLDYLRWARGDRNSTIEAVSFRDKQNGWLKYDMTVRFSSGEPRVFKECHQDNLYMRSFLRNLCLRPSCFHCPAKGGRSRADISLGDFWSIRQHLDGFDDDRGVTLVYINSDKGRDHYLQIYCQDVELDPSVPYNSMLHDSVAEKYPADKFWRLYSERGIDCLPSVFKSMDPSFPARLWSKVKHVLGRSLK